jgi:hypothetical protein
MLVLGTNFPLRIRKPTRNPVAVSLRKWMTGVHGKQKQYLNPEGSSGHTLRSTTRAVSSDELIAINVLITTSSHTYERKKSAGRIGPALILHY